MILYKTLKQEEILEALAYMAIGTLPSGTRADISAEFNDEGGVDIILYPEVDEKELN